MYQRSAKEPHEKGREDWRAIPDELTSKGGNKRYARPLTVYVIHCLLCITGQHIIWTTKGGSVNTENWCIAPL